MVKCEQTPSGEQRITKIAHLKLGLAHRHDVQQVMAKPVRYVPDDRFRRPTVMAAIMQHDIEVHPGKTLDSDQEQTIFLHLNYARHQMGLVRRRLLRTGKWCRKDVMELLHWNRIQLATRSKITICNIGLVPAMAKGANNCGVDFIDLVGDGNMALLRAIDLFDCSRGYKFSTYACKVIIRSFSKAIKKHNRYRQRFPVQLEPTFERDDHVAQRREERYHEKVGEVRTIIRKNLADLSRTELSVVEQRFSLGRPAEDNMTLQQVGIKLGYTK